MSILNPPDMYTSLPDEGAPVDDERDDGWRRAFTQGFVVLVIFAFIGLWFWQSDRTRRGLVQLPEADRKMLFDRTMQNLNTVCKASKDEGLDGFCRDQAELVLAFPECDDACRTVARAQLNRPTR